MAILFGSGAASASTTPSTPGASSPESPVAASGTPNPRTGAASAIEGAIGAFNADNGKITISLSASQQIAGKKQPVPIDRDSVKIIGSFQKKTQPIAAKAVSAGEASGPQVRRQVMLLLDTSESMEKDDYITLERRAALQFVEKVAASKVPLEVGIVTFGDPAKVVLPPTQKLAVVRSKIQSSLNPAGNTAMFEAVVTAVNEMDDDAARSLLMISDGKNDDRTGQVTNASAAQAALNGKDPVHQVSFRGILVGDEPSPNIFQIDGAGAVVQANNTATLQQKLQDVINSGVDEQVNSLTVSADIPAEWFGQRVRLTLQATSRGNPVQKLDFFDNVFPAASVASSGGLTPVMAQRSSPIPTWVMFAALLLVFGALAVLVTSAFGGLADQSGAKSAIVRRIEYFSVSGAAPARVEVTEQTTKLGDSALTRSAVGLMSRLARTSRLDSALDGQLESAGLPIRTAEWMLLHVGIAVGSALLLLVISGGKIVALILGLLIGLAGPWLFLNFARSRRVSKFLAQLPDTLQLLAGSLAAGYSLPQAMDSVVRESGPPISLEFNRALIEARLGMPAEDALDGIAKRTDSTDFSWIVMAIRIQRDVGGNLAELLSSVAGTLRERERLRRQVSALSAEGRLSGLILGALPLVFGLYLMLTRPTYIAPLFDTKQGILLLIIGTVLLVVGGFWMSKVIKVKV